ncbi:hypothetical protein P3G55_24850 [Leptospira sp. 96542]|nr:hypothetical protein [Leptospira sp. 96542]
MADLKYRAVRYDHAEFLAEAKKRAGFTEAYDELALEYTFWPVRCSRPAPRPG